MNKKRDLQKVIDEMVIASNALFSTAFDDRIDRADFLVRDVLEYLGYRNFKIISCKTQNRKSHLLQHDTITDVEILLESGEQLIVEVELSDSKRFTPKRSRYILGSNDVTTLQEGMDYSQLPPQILIVISRKDLNDSGLPIVKAKRILQETGQILNDEQTIVYVNLENATDEDTPINHYVKDFFEKDYRKIKNLQAREILRSVKKEGETRMQFEGLLQQMLDEEVKEKNKEINTLKEQTNTLKEENEKLRRIIQALKEDRVIGNK